MKNGPMTAVLILLAVVAWGKGAATNDVAQPVQFHAFPASILLAQGEEREITWVIHNPNQKDLVIDSIRPLSAEGVAVSVPNGPSGEASLVIKGLSDSVLAVKLRCTGEIQEEQRVYLHLDCRIEEGRRKVFDSLTVGPRIPPPVERIASLSVESNLQSINEHCPGWAYLVVTNKSNQPIQVGSAQVLAPEGVTAPGQPIRPFTLTGQDTATIPMKICVTNAVQPGSKLLVFDVAVTQAQYGREQIYHLVQKQPVTVGIMGESEVLKVLQIPSFLLLPGMLAVLTVGLLWSLFSEPAKRDKFPLPYTKEHFWVVAVTVSIAIGFLYPYFTAWCLGEKRNYLYGYGLKDIVWVWLLGIGAALLGCLLFAFGRIVVRWVKEGLRRLDERRLQRDYPTARDTPQTLLSKLQRQGLPLGLERARLRNGRELFLLQRRMEHADRYWLGPEITITLPEGLAPATEKAITDELVPHGSPGALLRYLEHGHVEGLAQANPPAQILASEIQDYLQAQTFVRIE